MTTKITITTAENPVEVSLLDKDTGQPEGPTYTVPAHREYATHIQGNTRVEIAEREPDEVAPESPAAENGADAEDSDAATENGEDFDDGTWDEEDS